MLPKRAALNQSPQGGLPRRPLSLPALKDGASRAILVSLVCWTGPLSALTARMRLTPTETHMLRHSIRKSSELLVDLPLNNCCQPLSALKRKLEAMNQNRNAVRATKRNV